MSKVVYLHRRKDDNSIFYVGMGDLKRAYCKKSRSAEWIEEVEKGYVVDIFKSGLSKKEAFELEKSLISEIGLSNLVNKTVGGEGGGVHYNNKEVYQYSLNGDFIKKYSSISKASALTGIHRQNISKCLKKKREYAGGYIWSLSKEYVNSKQQKIDRNKVILNESNGVFYENLSDYCDLYNINRTTVWRWLSGKRENKTNLKYV